MEELQLEAHRYDFSTDAITGDETCCTASEGLSS